MRSTFTLAPGSMPAPLGRRFKDRSGQVLLGAAPDGSDVNADRPPVYRGRRVHDLAQAVRQNLPCPRWYGTGGGFFCFRTRLEVLSPSPDVCFWWLGARPSRQPRPLGRGSRWRSHSVNFIIYMQRVKKKSFLQLLFLKRDDKLMKQILHFVPILAFFLSCRHHPSHWWQHEGEVLMAGGARGWRRWMDFIAFCLFFLILTDY